MVAEEENEWQEQKNQIDELTERFNYSQPYSVSTHLFKLNW